MALTIRIVRDGDIDVRLAGKRVGKKLPVFLVVD